ncbi:Protein phosphatase 2A regulatory subunit PR [Trema orientale]|uniref:Serine/threonine-protein phosphatase 2A 55 kDa regulatory subunit B n=1 Tax=Trema orientale TaxID=63057 RepID=A0A2P5CF30_TREOI|nr:Protein phosphatase 2A regulatory subunit PR [Trema orientale]
MTLSSNSRAPMEWKFSQVFGERAPGEDLQEVDIISAMGFDSSGDYLAVGDRGGRVVIFGKNDEKHSSNQYQSRAKLEELDFNSTWHPEFQYKTEFQSHEPEFDYLKSSEIEEKINKVRWCATSNVSLFILSTNNKTIKLWKVKERKVKKVKEMDSFPFVSSENSLLAEKSFMSGQDKSSVPNGYHPEWTDKMGKSMSLSQDKHAEIVDMEDTAHTRCRKVYAHAHDFNINSISTNSDGETFVSADDLRINLWNLEISGQCFNIVDMKPSNMEDLTEVITSAEFHPIHCNLLAYGSSRGFIRLVDMRQSALCDHSAIILKDGDSRGSKSFFTEIIASISDMKFSKDGRYILSRDYMNLKLWDMRMDSSPVSMYKIHEHLRPKACRFLPHGLGLVRLVNISFILPIDFRDPQGFSFKLESAKQPEFVGCLYMKPVLQAAPRARRSSLSNLTRGFYRHGHENSSSGSNDMSCNLKSKLLHLAWHPERNFIACAAGNSLFMYYA